MNIMTLSISPYALTSEGQLHANILEHLYTHGHAVASIAWAHDTSFFIPEEKEDGTQKYYYEFEHQNKTHKIPLVPFQRNNNDVVTVYEILQKYQPDIVITIGDYNDFFYMKAVKQFYSDLKWLFILNNYSYPINENDTDLINEADGVLCTSQFCYDVVKDLYKKDLIETHYVGCDHSVFNAENRQDHKDKFRIMTSGKNLQIDNIPMVMQAVAEIREDLPDLELYVLANIYDQGDYDLELLRQRFDPNSEFIIFPSKYVSLIDGLSQGEVVQQLNMADLFISIPMVASSSMGMFEAIACGCTPLMSDCGSNQDIARMFEEGHNYSRSNFLVPCIELMTRRENYLNVADPMKLKEVIRTAYENIKKNKGTKKDLLAFIRNYDRADFLSKVFELIENLNTTNQVVCLETV